MTLYRQAAEQGYTPAQTWLGSCYRMGEGVDQDFDEAVRWYRDAVTQGYADAEYLLGVCQRFGEGMPEDMAEALKWYRTAAKHGHAEAQCDLGSIGMIRAGSCFPHMRIVLLSPLRGQSQYSGKN